MKRRYLLSVAIIAILAAVTAFVVVRSQFDFAAPEPSSAKAHFDRIKLGMTLEEVEAILGSAGGNYSSDRHYDYYIWKSKGGWTSVIMEEGKLAKKHFNPHLSIDD